MTRNELISQIRLKHSFLCVGLDPDPDKMPEKYRGSADGVVEFCKQIIDATREYSVAYKPNIAFFEALGRKGWDALYQVAEYLPRDCFLIADAKRADIGNSSRMYARAFFEEMNFDAVTVAPYMGSDSVMPFLEYADKWTILLALTSNKGSQDFQMIRDRNGMALHERVIRTAMEWSTPSNLMFVIGATHPDMLSDVREIAPDHFFLVPGVGAQGGDLQSVAKAALTEDIGLLVNSTRAIIYASQGEHFAVRAGEKARAYRDEMARYILNRKM
jgi:orotidine-5'-phosphate decarboxylase